MKLRTILLSLLVLGVLSVLGAYAWIGIQMQKPLSHDKTNEAIIIEPGTAQVRVVEQLAQAGILHHPLAVKLYLRFWADRHLQAGTYQFDSPISALDVLDQLEEGHNPTQRITIPEGWTRFEIAARIAARFPTQPPTTEQDVLQLLNDARLIADFDSTADNLEGYLYPTTYEFEQGTTPEQVVARMLTEFRRQWQPEWDQRAAELGRSRREIVTIASLIENESKIEAERPLIASVIYNRLRLGIPLGIDATNVYIAKMLGRWDGILHKSDLEIAHPYNTRQIIGLPPGPISSASKSALRAALYPDTTDYLYYVLDVDKNDGSHGFYETAAGFNRAKAKYQQWLARQR
ncbi:MAG: endolytic transglycosylase MltG [Bacteroidetes bacterium]|nr:MAG: endolytic transglycosylase MltG [Bacteroidota bacterium]